MATRARAGGKDKDKDKGKGKVCVGARQWLACGLRPGRPADATKEGQGNE